MRFSGMRYVLPAITGAIVLAGCVERKLTIVTNPSEAVVWLNDEEIGTTPVTVNFNWYGEYRIRIEKQGYDILTTHQSMKRPLHDVFPFDFFAECLWPGRIVDTYHWSFDLKPFQQANSQELVQQAEAAQKAFADEMDIAKQQIQTVKEEKTKK